MVPKKFRLHTKLYYFESDTRYAAIVGSANITEGGLVHNDELSTVHHGTVGDVQHKMFNDYLEHLVALYKLEPDGEIPPAEGGADHLVERRLAEGGADRLI